MLRHKPDCDVPKFEQMCECPHQLSDGTRHWWSGWPGAYCMGCGVEDPREYCITMCDGHFDDEKWEADQD